MDKLILETVVIDAYTMTHGGVRVKLGANEGQILEAAVLIECKMNDTLVDLHVLNSDIHFIAQVSKVKTSEKYGLEFDFLLVDKVTEAFVIFNSIKAQSELCRVHVTQAKKEDTYAVEKGRIRKSSRSTTEREDSGRSSSERISGS